MPFWRNYYHLIWSTKNREPLITSEFEPELLGYLCTKAQGMGVQIYEINGWFDHIHLIVAIPPKLAVAEVVKNLKGASSHEFNQAGHLLYWQRGYGVITLGQRQLESARTYVRNQKIHHMESTTNFWLERDDDQDIRPDIDQAGKKEPDSVIREGRVQYIYLKEEII